MTDPTTQPLTDSDLADARRRQSDPLAHPSAWESRLLAEVDRLRTWDGLMSVLDKYLPEDIWPTRKDDPARDPGPRIVSLIRWVDRLRAENTAQAEQLAAGEASDGYHTHNELYYYRMLYNAHAAQGWLAAGHRVVKSWTHSDGEPCFGGGWFVVAADLPTGQVTNHYEAKHWGLFNVPEDVPPVYDGHTPAEAADRLRAALGLDQDGGQANG